MMRVSPYGLAALLVTAMVLTPTAAIGSCLPQTVVEQFAAADLVATGTVLTVAENDDGSAEILIEPTVVYKGDGLLFEDTIIILDEDGVSVQTSIDVNFQEGDTPYLLFLTANDDEETFTTSQCAGTRLLEAGLTADEQAALGAGQTIEELFGPIDEDGTLIDDSTLEDLLVEEEAASDSATGWVAPAADWLVANPWLALAGLVWTMVWKGGALWLAARRRQVVWFVVLLVVPTLGLLPIGYILVTRVRSSAPPSTPPV